jgi:transcriptional regulator GlxA family with amidase domain
MRRPVAAPPAKAIEAIRIDAARRRLGESTDRIETIAAHAGFTGEESHSETNYNGT